MVSHVDAKIQMSLLLQMGTWLVVIIQQIDLRLEYQHKLPQTWAMI